MPFVLDKAPCQCGHERWQHNAMDQCVLAIWSKKLCRCKGFVAMPASTPQLTTPEDDPW